MPLCCLKQHRNPLGKIWCTECTSLIAGAAIGDYVIDSHLGQGSTSAAVYVAHQPKLNNRKVVIKVLHSVASQESIETFRNEAAVLASLSHPYILPIYDYDIIEEVRVDQMGNYSYSPYLVLRYAEQGSLDEVFKQGGNRPWPLERILPIIEEAAEALDYAHYAQPRSILHRDVKPANILMVGTHIMLADFGVADLIDVDKSHVDAPWAGSPAYMAPEVWGYKPGRYSDQYALAVTCFRLLTGEYPWKIVTGGTTQWMHAHQYVAPLSLRSLRPDLPVAVGLVLQRAMAKKPHDRFPRVGVFASELRKASQDETQPLTAPPRLPTRPPMGAAPSPPPGSQGKLAPVQVEKAQPAARHLNGNGSTSSIQPFFEEQQNGEDPIGKIDITGSLSREISQKLQNSRWTLPAFILNFVICAVLVLVSWFSPSGRNTAQLLALCLYLCPALLVGPLVGRLFHRVPVSTYAWGVLWGMILGIVNTFLSVLVCCVWRVLIDVIAQGQTGLGLKAFQAAIINLLPQLAVPLLVGLWISVFGGALIGLLAARAQR
ncbi:MAG TPA: serine/threonine-protein kinase [Ktedonobacteraceae bacterium]|nr:serine/threonine-protein kinase [Ktedonobacteraceae bacterium]